jgi:hypothetical protein
MRQIAAHPRFDAFQSGVEDGLSPAILSGDSEVTDEILVTSPMSVNSRDAHGFCPLALACFGFGRSVLSNPNLAPSAADIRQALGLAVRQVYPEPMTFLSRLDTFDPNGRCDQFPSRSVYFASDALADLEFTPVISALLLGYENPGRILILQNGVELNVKGPKGESLIAASVKFPLLLPEIISRISDRINDVDIWGNSALSRAIEVGAFGAVSILIDCGIDLRQKNGRGETAWDIVCRKLRIEDTREPEDRETYVDAITGLTSGLKKRRRLYLSSHRLSDLFPRNWIKIGR